VQLERLIEYRAWPGKWVHRGCVSPTQGCAPISTARGTPPDAAYDEPFSAFGGADVIYGGAGLKVCDYHRDSSSGSTYALCYSATAASCALAANDGPDGDDLTNCSRLIVDDGPDMVTGSDLDDVIEGRGVTTASTVAPATIDSMARLATIASRGGLGGELLDGGPIRALRPMAARATTCVSVAVGSVSCDS
jgi:hypothetical protein